MSRLPPRTVAPLIQKGSTVLLPRAADLYDDGLITYGRGGLDTHTALVEDLKALEDATAVSLFPSGLAAMTASMLAVLKAGDEILVTDAVYKPTRRFCDRVLKRYGVATRYYPPRMPAHDLAGLCGPATRLIVMESPASLTLELQDVPAIAAMARQRGILTLIDNTWAAGLHFQPLAHGVDISTQSLTKYVGGHSDVFMGSAAVASEAMAALLDQTIIDFGWAVSPEDAYMMWRGLRTLPARMARHQDSGLKIAAWLQIHPKVLAVLHPALPSSPDYALWRRDFSGAAGLFSFVLDARTQAQANTFLDRLKLFGLGFSWGGFESLALLCDPQFTNRKERREGGGYVIRLSIGLEPPEALIADLEQGFAGLD